MTSEVKLGKPSVSCGDLGTKEDINQYNGNQCDIKGMIQRRHFGESKIETDYSPWELANRGMGKGKDGEL